jgi:putative ABC transport system permease protein
LALGYGGSRLVWSFRPAFLPEDTIALKMDWRVFLFTAAVAVITGVLFGIVPAARTSVANLAEILKTGGRGGSEGYARNRLRSALVIGEVSLALVALSAAGLLIRSMSRVEKINPGFETRNLFVFNFDIGPRHYAPEAGLQFERAIAEKARAVPGVRSVALASTRPFGFGLLATILIEGQDTDPKQHGSLATLNTVSPEYFDTLRIPLLEGRIISDFDRRETRRVAVINEAMARHFWPGQSALGKRFRLAVENDYREVVGVCANSVVFQMGEQPQMIAYLPLEQNYQSALALDVRTDGNPAAVMPAVLKLVQALDANMALTQPSTIEDLISQGLWAPRMLAALFGTFGVLGMVLASVGIYGVMSYIVAQRTNEIGLRMALGARPWDVLRLVVGQGMRLAAIGILLGIGGGLVVTRGMGRLLIDVPTDDPVTFGTVSVILAAVAFLAGWLPARRAARIDPMLALRQD